MTDVLRIPIPVEALRTVLGDALIDEALEVGAEAGGSLTALGMTAVEATAAGFLTVDVVRKLRIAEVYARRLELALSLMNRDVRNQYEVALKAHDLGLRPMAEAS